MGKDKTLKSALQSQQSRLKLKAKAAHAEKVAELKVRKKGHTTTKAKGKDAKRAQPPKAPTIPFKPSDRILLIGEGNFSFARSLVQEPPSSLSFLPPSNVTATAYDSEEDCYSKYPEAHSIISLLREKGVEVFFNIDATRLERYPAFKNRRWNRIVWNFPHAGRGLADQDRNILSNQMLILGFFRSSAIFLTEGSIPTVTGKKKRKHHDNEDEEGEQGCDDDEEEQMEEVTDTSKAERGTVLITLRNVVPYIQWNIPLLAKNPPPPTGSKRPSPKYIQLRSFQFHRNVWKGYEHRMTKGERGQGKGTTGEGGEDRTWEFCLSHDESHY